MTDPRLEQYQNCFVTLDEIEALSDGNPLIDHLIMETHIIAFVAKPGVGKSAVLRHLAKQMALNGSRVQYLDVDSAPSQIKRNARDLITSGVSYAAPQIKRGASVADLVAGLTYYADCQEDMSDMVIIMDTTKKFMNMMSKDSIKEWFLLLRSIGCTVILAAHANKHLDADGNIVYEGTGDLESDCDDMLMLYAERDDLHGLQTISSYIHKARSADITPQSWRLDVNTMELTDCDYVDVRASEVPEKPLKSEIRNILLLGIVDANINEDGIMLNADARDLFMAEGHDKMAYSRARKKLVEDGMILVKADGKWIKKI